MNTLQNNFTTPEQSKRLLELGVPADSADLFFPSFENGDKSQPHLLYDLSYSQRVPIGYEKLYLPCWSVGRMVEICLKCSTLEQRQVRFFCNGDDDEYSLIDYVVTALESGIMTNHIDFSKLEE